MRCTCTSFTGRAEERLSFDVQRDVAIRLGYTAHPGLKDVERFMKHSFLIAKDVGDLTAILCADLEARHEKGKAVLNRPACPAEPASVGPAQGRWAQDFNDEQYPHQPSPNPKVFERDPINLIRIFHLAQNHNLAFHPDAMRIASHSLKLINKELRDNEEANQLFFEILTAKKNVEIVLRRMNEVGVLGRFNLDFGQIVSMMQFNMYHHYTVDEHLLRCIGILAEIERRRPIRTI